VVLIIRSWSLSNTEKHSSCNEEKMLKISEKYFYHQCMWWWKQENAVSIDDRYETTVKFFLKVAYQEKPGKKIW
jgi:hypothetical protein